MPSSKRARLIIDMQQGLFRASDAPFVASIMLSNICLLITKARQAEVPVFFARHIGPADSLSLPDYAAHPAAYSLGVCFGTKHLCRRTSHTHTFFVNDFNQAPHYQPPATVPARR